MVTKLSATFLLCVWSGEDYLEVDESRQLSCRRQSPGLFSKAVPGWDTEAEQEEHAAAAVPQCLGRTSNGSEKINSFVALNWEGKRKNKQMSCLVFC